MTRENNISHTRKVLLTIFIASIALAVLTVIAFESGLLAEGSQAGTDTVTAEEGVSEFVIAIVMELLTLCVIPLSLRMFKVRHVADRLRHSPEGLLRYGSVRILLLGVPLVANTLLYYIYMSVAFGYMALILLLAMTFVYPSATRCMAETDIE